MEMGWIVIVEKHSNDDSIKSTNLWHSYFYFTLNAFRFHLANGADQTRLFAIRLVGWFPCILDRLVKEGKLLVRFPELIDVQGFKLLFSFSG
jgi:hypothetical protein